MLSEHNNGLTERYTHMCVPVHCTIVNDINRRTAAQVYWCLTHQQRRCVFKSVHSLCLRAFVCMRAKPEKNLTTNAKVRHEQQIKTTNRNEFKKGEKNDNKLMQLFVIMFAAQVSALNNRFDKKLSFFVSYRSQSFARRISELRI